MVGAGLNSIIMRERPADPERSARLADNAQAARLAVFGAAVLAEAEAHPPVPAAVSALAWDIESLCTDARSSHFNGIAGRAIHTGSGEPARLRWNPAGILGGFSPEPGVDDALATINWPMSARHWDRPDNVRLPRRLVTLEGLSVDSRTGTASVYKTILHARSLDVVAGAVKRASGRDLTAARRRLQLLADNEQSTSTERPLPLYVEIGSGLDPMSLRGRRTYVSKACLEIDKAEGSYANRFGEYSAAVQTQSAAFAAEAATKRPGQHIAFTLADGTHLPLPDSRVREVFLSNVLNAGIDDETRHHLLQETGRVLDRHGLVVIRANWHTDTWPHDTMVDLVRRSFGISRTVTTADVEAYSRLDQQYGTPREVPAPDGYYVIAYPRNKDA